MTKVVGLMYNGLGYPQPHIWEINVLNADIIFYQEKKTKSCKTRDKLIFTTGILLFFFTP